MLKHNWGKVAVLMGGNSAERSISLQSGQAVCRALQQAGINAVPIDTAEPNVISAIIKHNFDRAFIVLHGPEGEDGTVQGALQMLGIPYTGSGVKGCAIAMDKVRCLQLWRQCGVPVAPFALVTGPDHTPFVNDFQLPVAVKPVHEGSSIGVSKVKSWDQFAAAYATAAEYGEVMIEQWLTGKELGIGLVGEHILPSVWIEPKREYYDYQAKYDPNSGTCYHCPSGLGLQQEQRLARLAALAFAAAGCTGWGRIDAIQQQDGQIYLMEANPIPGMTTVSLVPKAASQYGWDFTTLCLNILAQTL